MTDLVVVVFVATYLGMALGRVPGLRIDRTGIALMALAVLLFAGALDMGRVGQAIDAPTIVLLFALMILSAQYQASGFYDACAMAIVRARLSPSFLLLMTIVIAGGLSALLANDIVCFALAPLLCTGIAGRGLDPRPFLLGLAAGSNAGSAATVIGNPQNILIGQVGKLDFLEFLAVCGVPALLSLPVVFVVIRLVWARSLTRPEPPRDLPPPAVVDRWQMAKAVTATALLVILFFTPEPREIGALAIAALLLASRRLPSREMIGGVDWHLLLLFACLFAVTAAFADTGLPERALGWLAERELLPDRLSVLTPLALAMSNSIGNVPAVILLLTVWPDPPTGALYGLALLSTLAGNFLLLGSLANLIVAERAATRGVVLGFGDFAASGIPITIVTMAIAAGWLGAFGWLPWG